MDNEFEEGYLRFGSFNLKFQMWHFVWLSYYEALIEILLLYVVNGWVYRYMPCKCSMNCVREKEFGTLVLLIVA